ncbi:MAG: DUF2232 domain-containing protein [Desulfuromonadales bacterium]|nr:DUF2232 domain-containing protein [Desulfuromonadales bacterium]
MTGERTTYLLAGSLVTLALQLAAGLLGPLGLMFNLVVAVPAAYAGMRQGAAVAAGIVALTSAVLVLVGGPGGAFAYLLQFGLASWLLPFLLRRGWSWGKALVTSLLAVCGASGATLVGYSLLQGTAVGLLVAGYVQGEIDRALGIYTEAGISGEQLAELEVLTRQMADFLLQAWPALAVVAIGALLLLLLLLLWAFSSGRYEIPGPALRQWKVPENFIWPLIAGGAGIVLGGDWVQRIALNLLVLVLPIYFLQGLAIVQHYFWKRNTSPFLRRLGYVLIAVLNPLPLIVTGLGVFDMWIDFRKPRIKKS